MVCSQWMLTMEDSNSEKKTILSATIKNCIQDTLSQKFNYLQFKSTLQKKVVESVVKGNVQNNQLDRREIFVICNIRKLVYIYRYITLAQSYPLQVRMTCLCVCRRAPGSPYATNCRPWWLRVRSQSWCARWSHSSRISWITWRVSRSPQCPSTARSQWRRGRGCWTTCTPWSRRPSSSTSLLSRRKRSHSRWMLVS